ncbi:MAG TPA: hypothetical protein ENJ86_05675 [Methylothermaceae bacterium]|nr:hypothetical protein [Methylothermaceae bacterium]
MHSYLQTIGHAGSVHLGKGPVHQGAQQREITHPFDGVGDDIAVLSSLPAHWFLPCHIDERELSQHRAVELRIEFVDTATSAHDSGDLLDAIGQESRPVRSRDECK